MTRLTSSAAFSETRFSPTGQFRFSGDKPITPATAALPQAASYPAQTLAVPVPNGNSVFFATTYGTSAGISQFSLDPQIENLSVASPMAEDVIGFIDGSIQQIIASPNIGMILARTEEDKSLMYVLEFEPQVDILKPVVPAWSRWSFGWGMRIISMRAGDDYIEFMAAGKRGTSEEGNVGLYRIDLFGNRKIKSLFDVNYGDIHLDVRFKQPDTNTTVTLPVNYPEYNGGIFIHRDIVVVQGEDCPNPGLDVSYTRVGNVLTLDTDMQGGKVRYGYQYASSIVPPDLNTRDASGVIQTQAHLRVSEYVVSVTGHMDAIVGLKTGEAYPTQEWRGKVVGSPNTTTDNVGYNRGEFRVQYRQNAKNAVLLLQTESHIAMDIHQIEWRGTYNKRGRRF